MIKLVNSQSVFLKLLVKLLFDLVLGSELLHSSHSIVKQIKVARLWHHEFETPDRCDLEDVHERIDVVFLDQI